MCNYDDRGETNAVGRINPFSFSRTNTYRLLVRLRLNTLLTFLMVLIDGLHSKVIERKPVLELTARKLVLHK